MLVQYAHSPGADVPVAAYWPGLTLFLGADQQGSIIALSDYAGGVPMGINTYDEYGIPGVTNQGRFQYTGQAWLAELGMYYYKARIYSPTLGRFLQTDPIGYEGGINIYSYVGNDPVNAADPSGLQVEARAASPAVNYVYRELGDAVGSFISQWWQDVSDSSPDEVLAAVAAQGIFSADRTSSEAISEDTGIHRLATSVRRMNRAAIARSCCSEARVLRSLGLPRNTTRVRSREGVAVPDAMTARLSLEIKDTAAVSMTQQLRIQVDAAHAAGREAVLVTGTHTRVSGPAQRTFDRIIRRNDLGPQRPTGSRLPR